MRRNEYISKNRIRNGYYITTVEDVTLVVLWLTYGKR